MKTENTHIVQLKDLSLGYIQPLISNINTEVLKGEIVLLIGKNGTGKTTLLRTILKEIAPLSGSVKITGTDIAKIPASEIGKLISVVFSKSKISPELKVYDLIALGRYPYKKWYQKLTKEERKEIDSVINLFELDRYKEYFVHELSDGNLQKAMIARALVQDTPLLILDEPTSHLDISNKLEVMRIIRYLAKEKGKTIVFTSHDLTLGLTIADKLWMIKDNNLNVGFTEDLASQKNILDYFAGTYAKFNYAINEYEFIRQTNKIEVKLTGDSQSLYWLRKALLRNSFAICENTKISITKKEPYFIIQNGEAEYSFISIEEVISFLLSLYEQANFSE